MQHNNNHVCIIPKSSDFIKTYSPKNNQNIWMMYVCALCYKRLQHGGLLLLLAESLAPGNDSLPSTVHVELCAFTCRFGEVIQWERNI